MRYPLFSIRDSLVGFGIPFSADNDAVAMRYFDQAIQQPNSIYSLNKNNFDLYSVGFFDTESGEIEPVQPKYICSANDFTKE